MGMTRKELSPGSIDSPTAGPGQAAYCIVYVTDTGRFLRSISEERRLRFSGDQRGAEPTCKGVD